MTLDDPRDINISRTRRHLNGALRLQIAGRHRDEWSVLQLAYAFGQATRHVERRPPDMA